MRETQRKGDTGKAKAIATFTELGYDVGVLLTESAPYDLVVDDGTKLHRVQAKYITDRLVDLRRIHSNSKGYVVNKPRENAYDWLYVYRSDGKEFLIKECLFGRSTYTPQSKDEIRRDTA